MCAVYVIIRLMLDRSTCSGSFVKAREDICNHVPFFEGVEYFMVHTSVGIFLYLAQM